MTERRIVPRVVVLLIAVLALSSCTGSSPAGAAQTPATGPGASPESLLSPPPTPRPLSCPPEPRYGKYFRRNDVPGLHGRLVPGKPSVLVECLPSRRVIIGDDPAVARFVRELNALKLGKPGAVYSCPFDSGLIYGLFFNYPNGDVLLITVNASGCTFASNGQRFAFTTEALRKLVEHPRRVA